MSEVRKRNPRASISGGLPGLTSVTSEDKPAAPPSSVPTMILKTLAFGAVPKAVGLAIATAVFKFGSYAKYTRKLSALPEDYHWLCLSTSIFATLCGFVNFYAMGYKSRLMTTSAGNLRANMYIFKTLEEEEKDSKMVVLDDQGDPGSYNRANRSLHHFVENTLGFLLQIPIASQVFAFPTFVCTMFFALGRMMHQVGYSNKGYGAHGPGFGISMVASSVVDGLVVLTALKSLGVV